MFVGKAICLLLMLLVFVKAGDDQLIKIGQKHSCIKQIITVFVANKNCDMLDDSAKSNLALKMTECLMSHMGKGLPPGCTSTGQSCKLEGDSWNTFSTFFTHIDNLCHFYWEMLHHERAELLISELSQSSQNAEMLLRKNALETQKILVIQQTMHVSMEQSLMNQKQMSKLINDSAKHISNLTVQMESFVKKIHQDINQNYGSVRNILVAMNEGLSQALSIQSYMTAQLSSIRGTLYFLSHFLLLLFITTLKRFVDARMNCLILLAINLLSEITFGPYIQNFLGTHRFRYLFILLEIALLWQADNKQNDFQKAISIHLNTPRLKSLFKKAIRQNQSVLYRIQSVSSDLNPEGKWKVKSAQKLAGNNSQL